MREEGTKSHRSVRDERAGPTITPKKQEKHRCIGERIKCICGSSIIVETGRKEIIIKTRVLKANKASNEVRAKCANCKRWVKVPLICF